MTSYGGDAERTEGITTSAPDAEGAETCMNRHLGHVRSRWARSGGPAED
ncbi:hypothetical protein ACFQ71_24185 [Streptomyces sp. NPDC056534]